MITVRFSSPSVIAYCSGRDETQPLQVSNIPQITMLQTHSNHVTIATEPKNQPIEDCDAILTSTHGILLKVRHADCLPVLLYHHSGVIGAVHAGRKGTELGILTKTLQTLQTQFDIKDSLEIWLGPAICKNCYQIDQPTDLHYDLIEKNTDQIRSVFSETEASIQNSHLCTAHTNKKFFSYRKEGKGVPMNWSGIALVTSK